MASMTGTALTESSLLLDVTSVHDASTLQDPPIPSYDAIIQPITTLQSVDPRNIFPEQFIALTEDALLYHELRDQPHPPQITSPTPAHDLNDRLDFLLEGIESQQSYDATVVLKTAPTEGFLSIAVSNLPEYIHQGRQRFKSPYSEITHRSSTSELYRKTSPQFDRALSSSLDLEAGSTSGHHLLDEDICPPMGICSLDVKVGDNLASIGAQFDCDAFQGVNMSILRDSDLVFSVFEAPFQVAIGL